MIKKKLFKYVSVLMCTAMVATGMTGCSSRVNDKVENNNDTQIEKVIESVAAKKGSSVVGTTDNKAETVYVFTDATGSQEKVLVNEKLVNVSELASITDFSELKDIINLSGDEKFTNDNGKLVWQSNGNNITYQGTVDKKAPVSIKVKYYLDGKEMSPADIKGKSGKVKIRYEYTNNAKTEVTVDGAKKNITVPFTMITGVVLNDKFTNIEVVNGKAMDVDNQVAVIGVAMPGLSDSIGKQDKIKIPEYFEITADVTDFSLDMAVTVASAGLLSEDAFDNINLSDLGDKSQTLVNGANALEQGSKDLSDGLGTLNSKMPELIAGIKQLDDGAAALGNGTNTLTDGLTQFAESINKQVKPGVEQLTTGSATLSAGINKLSSTLTGSFEQIKNNATTYATKVAQAQNNAKTIDTLVNANLGNNVTINAMLAQVSALAGGVDMKVNAYSDLSGDLTNEAAVAGLLTKYMTQYTVAVKLETANPQALAQLNGALTQASSNSITTLSQLYSKEIGLLLQVTSNGGVATALNTVYNTAVNTVDEQTGMNLSQSLTALQTGAKQLAEGTAQLNTSFGKYEASDSITICSSLYKLVVGSRQLSDNMGTLKAGTSQLSSSAKTLSEGVKTLYDGSVTLKDGMIELNESGISAIASLINEDATDLVDTLKAIAKAGADYDTFAGKADGIDGSVKFIYKTNGI